MSLTKKQKKLLLRIIITGASLIILYFLPLTGIWRLLLYFAVYLLIGYNILRKAGKGILNGRIFDENFLMTVATLGAFALAVYDKSGDYNEAIAVMLFYQIGELFESIAVGKSRKNISALMDIRPDYANLEQEGSLAKVSPDEVSVGSVIVVQPGEKVPIDGIVLEGSSSLNTSALTGESVPLQVKEGEAVLSGCVNMTKVLRITTTKEFGESTVSRILELVEESGASKSRPERFISRFARVYTPVVCILAVMLAVIPPLFLLISGADASWHIWIYRALTFLVISCPCALVISIPLSFFAGIGKAGHEGILIKGSNYLEALARTRVVVFDKTGTLTEGAFEFRSLHYPGFDEKESAGQEETDGDRDFARNRVLEYAALAECASSHPISLSLQKAYGRKPDRTRVRDVEEISGKGVIAMVDGKRVVVGNSRLMEMEGLNWQECSSTGTIIHVGIDGEYAGHLVISDVLKPTSEQAVRELKKNGVEKTVMFTGDLSSIAEKAASQAGIDEVKSELLPAQKVEELEKLLKQKTGEKDKVAFVGDGINDAPVLMRADIGIAMGALGSDAAIEAADIVLMDDDPLKIVRAIQISRKCLGIVFQNIIFALGIKGICLLLSALGVANMWYAIFADVGVMVIAVLNSIRTLR